MSVHSHSAGHHDPVTAAGPDPARGPLSDATSAPEFPAAVVTAVLVSHDGARWLPKALAGLLGQQRPVQNAVASDTGSADDSARLLAEALGDARVLHLARRTGFGAAVDEAARTAGVLTPDDLPYLKRPSGWDPVTRTWRDEAYEMPELPYGEPEQWLWLLHDDCAPEPDALAQLLRVVENERELGRETAIVGPKLLGWYDRRQLLEVGASIAHSGRRWTGLDRREQDQGQHDHVRPVLSVSTAGMLIRRDVYEQLGGFDRRLPLMRDDVDLCWRAHQAGHRVLVAPDAVVRHAEAASRERRTVDCVGRTAAADRTGTGRFARQGTGPHRVDKAGAAYTLLVNSRTAVLPWVLLRLVVGTVVRTLAYLVGKVPGQALDEIAGLCTTLLRPERILAGRRRRKGSVLDKGELRALFPPPGATVRHTVEQVAGNLIGRSEPEVLTAGRHGGAVESGPGGDDADFLEIEQFARLKRVARRPGPVLFFVLLFVSLIACRSLLGSGALAGGALLPAPPDAWDLWSRYTDGWHPVGTGGTQSAPPYLALVALLATVFFGSTGLAVTVLLVCSVPLAGFSAYFASRPLVGSRLLRAWASVAYAFLPAATGALAGGRIGTAVLAILLPLIARAGIAAAGLATGDRGSWRATWAYALLLTTATAFTPIVWPLALVLGLGLLALRRGELRAHGLRLLAALGAPLVVLAPWSLSLLPFGFFREAGLDYGEGAASVLDLLGTSPGGPGTVGGLVLTGIVLAALAALLRRERQFAIRVAWTVALTGFLFAALSNSSAWAGPATLVYGIALLGAAALGAEEARGRVAQQSFGWRQPLAALIALAAFLGPLSAALGWMADGADGPLERRDPVQVPAFVAEESRTPDQPRTLILGSDSAAEVSYTLIRGSGARMADAELTGAADRNTRLDKVVANLVAGSGANQADQLGGFAVRYVLVRDGAPREMSRVLDATPGLTRLSQQDGSALWRVDRQVARAVVVPKSGEPLPVAAGPVELHTELPAGGEGRVLRLADTADEGWTATLDGRPLTKVTLDGWAQGFALPSGGGRLDLGYEDSVGHTAWLFAQGFLALVLVVMALPGRRRHVDDDLPEEPLVPAQAVAGEGRRARRLRAQAVAEGQPAPQDPAAPAPPSAGPAPAEPGGVPGAEQEFTPPATPPPPAAPPAPPGTPPPGTEDQGTATPPAAEPYLPQQQGYEQWAQPPAAPGRSPQDTADQGAYADYTAYGRTSYAEESPYPQTPYQGGAYEQTYQDPGQQAYQEQQAYENPGTYQDGQAYEGGQSYGSGQAYEGAQTYGGQGGPDYQQSPGYQEGPYGSGQYQEQGGQYDPYAGYGTGYEGGYGSGYPAQGEQGAAEGPEQGGHPGPDPRTGRPAHDHDSERPDGSQQ
ncbi:membrane-associated glycosyltransferase [Streptomyces albus]|uniref:Membrane-associated glycosyltransferase n=1 Tax=Streptomyces albus (strain ATCC 21838 / DSM 41398 / FERM P-419 / JCM 4703 / NBRC 107858) TaxID=1081613 RepID=A0A0B5EKV9_STRA4|nr:membrane-associated glycosyltransferase [Streptomyces albus]AOU77260.1 membrane-associated glycosyltransferase [Streptomyces albus]AYN33036.1 family 2 glycosyl transferase [Streptomyces albus]